MILVIGSTGNIGQQLVKQLDASGQKVRALARDAKKAPTGKNVEAVAGDLAKPETLDKAFSGVDAMFIVVNAGPDMVQLEKNAYAAAKKNGVKHVVQLSVAGASLDSPVSLAKWHGESEKNLKESGLAYSILQPQMFMQNQFGNIGSIKGEGKFYGSFKKGHVPVIDIADISATAAAILTSPAKHAGKTYFLTGPEPLTFDQIAEKFTKALGKPVSYVDIPSSALTESLLKMGLPEFLAKDFGMMSDYLATDAANMVSPDVENITGRKPRTFDAFLTDVAGMFK